MNTEPDKDDDKLDPPELCEWLEYRREQIKSDRDYAREQEYRRTGDKG